MTHLRGASLAAALIAAALLSACATAPSPTTPPAAPPRAQAPQPAAPPLREYSYRQPEAPAATPDNRIVLIPPPPPAPDPLPPEPADTVAATYTGLASWYGRRFHGRRTASGEHYDMAAMTAAHKTLPFGSRVRVTNLDNGRSVVVVINDRGPFVKRRVIDVSRAAAKELGFLQDGVTRVRIDVLEAATDIAG